MSWRWILAGLVVLVAIGLLGALTKPGRPTPLAATRAAPPTGLPEGGRCTGPELSVQPGPALGATGPQNLSIALRNRGTRTCTLGGTPTLHVFATATEMRFRYVKKPAAPKRQLALSPGGLATFSVLREPCERVIAKYADTITVQPVPDGALLGYPVPAKQVRFCAGTDRTGDAALAGNLLQVTPLEAGAGAAPVRGTAR